MLLLFNRLESFSVKPTGTVDFIIMMALGLLLMTLSATISTECVGVGTVVGGRCYHNKISLPVILFGI